jgi:uncharacterized membrane protein
MLYRRSMEIALLSQDGLLFVLRWLHFFFGVLWIGLLYYFNFVQGAFFAETDAATKSAATQKLVPRALWWFRWAAMFTMITGVLYLGARDQQLGHNWGNSYGVAILTGAAFALTMWANVWFVIWPNQKVVIQSATQAATGGSPLPNAAASAARALVASRTNVLFSIPMLFFMGAASHLPIRVNETAHLGLLAVVILVIIGALQFNALKGKTGPLTTIKGVIHCGFALAIVVYGVVEVLTK